MSSAEPSRPSRALGDIAVGWGGKDYVAADIDRWADRASAAAAPRPDDVDRDGRNDEGDDG